jgi:hypothetical protein
VLLEGDRLGGDVTHQRREAYWRLTESSDHHEPRVYTDTHCQPYVRGRSRWTRLFVETLQQRQRGQPCPHDVILLGQRGAKHGQDPISHRQLERAAILLHRILDARIKRLHQAIEGIEVV